MAFAIFALILIASLVIAILSKRGAVSSDMGDVMTAGGSFRGIPGILYFGR